MRTQVFLILIFLLNFNVQAREDAPLDPPYPHKMGLKRDLGFESLRRLRPASNSEKVIGIQTSVKAQISRGTCSMFSATAILESKLISIKGLPITLDLSEEWLEYIAVRGKTSDGGNSPTNFSLLREHGIPDEIDMPYIGDAWSSLSSSGLIFERCGHLSSHKLTSCLLTHWDPDFLYMSENELQQKSPEFFAARAMANAFRDSSIHTSDESVYVSSESEAKKHLEDGTPIILDIDFYYGAWNHRIAPTIGVKRNMASWYRGIVGYPEVGSVDLKNSTDEPAGHSFVVVGYDDKKVIETEVLMTDGSKKKFKHVGVYYFKNSWGTDGFGKKFTLNGKSYPGYGLITQDYAHEYGAFFNLPLR
ncbi:MAG: C1 family peptidase [Pseudomonadota bacterium]|nr:C1 family peptidase [Pseudomonadota bacterium]